MYPLYKRTCMFLRRGRRSRKRKYTYIISMHHLYKGFGRDHHHYNSSGRGRSFRFIDGQASMIAC